VATAYALIDKGAARPHPVRPLLWQCRVIGSGEGLLEGRQTGYPPKDGL
jgi:hypothetical protein